MRHAIAPGNCLWFTTSPQLRESAWHTFLREHDGDPFPNLVSLRFFPSVTDLGAMAPAMLARLRTLWIACVHTGNLALPPLVRHAIELRFNAMLYLPRGEDGSTLDFSEVGRNDDFRAIVMGKAFAAHKLTHTQRAAHETTEGFEPLLAALRRATGLERLVIQEPRINGTKTWASLLGAIGDSMPNLRDLTITQNTKWQPYNIYFPGCDIPVSNRCLLALAFGSAFAQPYLRADERGERPAQPGEPQSYAPVREIVERYFQGAAGASSASSAAVAPVRRLPKLARLYFLIQQAMGQNEYFEEEDNHSCSVAFVEMFFGPMATRPFLSLRDFSMPWECIVDGETIYPADAARTISCFMMREQCSAYGCARCYPPEQHAPE